MKKRYTLVIKPTFDPDCFADPAGMNTDYLLVKSKGKLGITPFFSIGIKSNTYDPETHPEQGDYIYLPLSVLDELITTLQDLKKFRDTT